MYLPVALHDQQYGGRRCRQQHQFLLFARMSSSMKQLVYGIKRVGRPQSIIMHEQAVLLSCSYIISSMPSQLLPLFGGILIKSTVICRFWPNSNPISLLFPVFLGPSIFLPQHPAFFWLSWHFPPSFSFFPSREDIFMSPRLSIFPLKPTPLSLFSTYSISIPLLLGSQF